MMTKISAYKMEKATSMKFKELFDALLNEEDGLNGKDIRKINVYGSEGKIHICTIIFQQ